MRLIALANTTTTITVTSGARSAREHDGVLARERHPEEEHRDAEAATGGSRPAPCPAILAGGDTSRRSSSAPTTNITAGAEHQAGRLGVAGEHLVELGDLRRDRHRHEEADEHRRAAERRHRLRVHARAGSAGRSRRSGSRAVGRAGSGPAWSAARPRRRPRSLPPAGLLYRLVSSSGYGVYFAQRRCAAATRVRARPSRRPGPAARSR